MAGDRMPWHLILRRARAKPIADYRGLPTCECPCGCAWINVPVLIDPNTRTVGAWATSGTCHACGALLSVATPVDKEITDDL